MSSKSTNAKPETPLNKGASGPGDAMAPEPGCSVYLEALLEHTGDAILICDEKGIPKLFNSTYAALMKKVYGLEMQPGILPHKLLENPEDVAYWDSLHERALSGEFIRTSYTHCFDDNDIRNYEFSICPIRENQNIKGFSAVAVDVTSKKAAEDALLESEERFRMLFDCSPTAMLITAADSGIVVYVNQKFCTLANLQKEKIIGQKAADLLVFSGETEALPDEKSSPETFVDGVNVDILVQDGINRAAEMFSSVISLAGKPHIISSFNDITDSREKELRLRQAQRMEAIGTLTAGIAHDYNNMLTVILGNISLARQISSPDDEITKYLDLAEKASMKIKQLTSELMSLARGGDLKLKPGNLQGLLRNAASSLSGNNLISVKSLLPNSLWPVLHDSSSLNFVIQNVLTNAAESMPGGGKIVLEAKNVIIPALQQKKGFPLSEGSYVKISIIDQGIGISGDALPRIFDPYFSTKEKGEKKGLGLGLATAYNIIKKHKGYIAIESEVGKGTAVTIYIPAINEIQN